MSRAILLSLWPVVGLILPLPLRHHSWDTEENCENTYEDEAKCLKVHNSIVVQICIVTGFVYWETLNFCIYMEYQWIEMALEICVLLAVGRFNYQLIRSVVGGSYIRGKMKDRLVIGAIQLAPTHTSLSRQCYSQIRGSVLQSAERSLNHKRTKESRLFILRRWWDADDVIWITGNKLIVLDSWDFVGLLRSSVVTF